MVGHGAAEPVYLGQGRLGECLFGGAGRMVGSTKMRKDKSGERLSAVSSPIRGRWPAAVAAAGHSGVGLQYQHPGDESWSSTAYVLI